MTNATKRAPLLTAAFPGSCPGHRSGVRAGFPAAALAALLLAGCSTGHIGESWQCPLPEAGTCDSVAAADPAVPGATGGPVLAEPLWRVRASETDTAAAAPCEADCGAFDPFAWLARLFAAETAEGEARLAGGAARAPSGMAAQRSGSEPGAESDAPAAAGTTEPATPAPLPAEAGLSQAEAAPDGPEAGDLRTGEIVARIWIAPFVDANGVYREASHVRVVLEPAGWRLP